MTRFKSWLLSKCLFTPRFCWDPPLHPPKIFIIGLLLWNTVTGFCSTWYNLMNRMHCVRNLKLSKTTISVQRILQYWSDGSLKWDNKSCKKSWRSEQTNPWSSRMRNCETTKSNMTWWTRWFKVTFFEMVKWPHSKVKWPPNWGWKGHKESPGRCFLFNMGVRQIFGFQRAPFFVLPTPGSLEEHIFNASQRLLVPGKPTLLWKTMDSDADYRQLRTGEYFNHFQQLA